MKKILFIVIVVPMVLMFTIGMVNDVSAMMAGTMTLSEIVYEHRFMLGLFAAIGIFHFLSPFKA